MPPDEIERYGRALPQSPFVSVSGPAPPVGASKWPRRGPRELVRLPLHPYPEKKRKAAMRSSYANGCFRLWLPDACSSQKSCIYSCTQPIACHPGCHFTTRRTACAARLRPLFWLSMPAALIGVSIGQSSLAKDPFGSGTLRGPPDGADTNLPTCVSLDSSAARSSLCNHPMSRLRVCTVFHVCRANEHHARRDSLAWHGIIRLLPSVPCYFSCTMPQL
jgi:hypothetical protein